MALRSVWFIPAIAALAGCGGGSEVVADLASTGSGLEGRVVRWPIAPVCQEGVSCEAPFSAGFSVYRASHLVARFRSDAEGAYSVRLTPGTYDLLPDADAPVMRPQRQSVTVEPQGVTHLDLTFDTGIR